jgi:hypothetical protein
MKQTILSLAVSGFVAAALLTGYKSPSEKVALAKAKESGKIKCCRDEINLNQIT